MLKALAIRPDDRYQDAAALLEDLMALPLSPHPDPVALSPTISRDLLGEHAAGSLEEVAQMLEEARRLSQQAARTDEAADLMEEAFGKAPGLRSHYVDVVRRWRSGVVE